MESTKDRIQFRDAGQFLSVSQHVDDAGVTASTDDDETPVSYLDDQRLLVEHEGIRLPLPVAESLLRREPALELRRPLDFAGDKNSVIQKKRRLPLLDDLEARS